MTAPMLGTLAAPVHRFTFGTAEITTILDGTVRIGVNPPFLMDKSDPEIAAIAHAAHLPTDRLENGFVPTLVNTGTELVLFDTGFGAIGRERGGGHLVDRLAAAGYAPQDIDVVALTHCHPDHIGGIVQDGAPTFPNARHVIGRREFDEWRSGANIPARRAENRALFMDLIAPMADRLTFLEDGDSVAPGIEAVAAFGHSPGHMMYRIDSAGASALVWGDAVNHYVFSLAHPGSPVAFDDDKDAGIATRKRVLDMVATDGLLVAGHHMPFPSVGHVERSGASYRWVPLTYQQRV